MKNDTDTSTNTNAGTLMDTADIKARADDRLANLPPEDRERLIEWLQSHTLAKVQHLAALPRPEGLDLKTSSPALSRFNAKCKLARLLESRMETIALVESVSNSSPAQVPPLRPLLLQTLEEKALHELIDPDVSLSEQSKLANFVLRLTRLRDEEQRRVLEEKTHQIRERRATAQAEELRLRQDYQQIAIQNQTLAAQRFTFQSVHLLRQQFPFPDQIDLKAEANDIHTISCLLQSVLTGGNSLSAGGEGQGEVAPPSHSPVVVDVSPR